MKRLIPTLIIYVTAITAVVVPGMQARQQPPGVLAGPNSLPAKATISGVVTRATSGDPIQRATVTLTRVASPVSARAVAAVGPQGQLVPQQPPQVQAPQAQQQPLAFTATTDEQGRFQFKDVDEGSYRIAAARNGFVRQEYGQRSASRPGTPLPVRAGQQVADLAFRLTPASTISGRVLDSNGEPVPGVTVQALRSSYDATGKRTLQPVASDRTNDLGEYRIYWINAGRYFVSANAARSAIDIISAGASQASVQIDNPAQAQAATQAASIFGGPQGTPNEVVDASLGLTYYPGSTDPSRAVALDLPAGSEMRAVDFNLVRTQRVRVSGRVIDSTTGRPPQIASVGVTPRDSSASSALDALIGAAGNRYDSATGEFVVQNVANGSYWLQVTAQNQPPPTPNATPTPAEALAVLNGLNTAKVPIEVQDADLNDLVLNVGPGMTIRGRVQIEGGQPLSAADLARIGFSLQSTGGGTSILTLLQGGPVRAEADGSFSLPRITAGEYKLSVSGLSPALYVKDARFGRQDALSGVTISDPPREDLEVVLRPNPGQVSGVVFDAVQKPIAGVQVVLVPDRARDRQDLYRNAATDSSGRFTLRNVTPGDYRIFAWEDIEPFSYFDPAILDQYQALGRLVRIQEAATETADVRLIPSGTP